MTYALRGKQNRGRKTSRRIFRIPVILVGILLAVGCSAVPSQFVAQAQPVTVIESPPSNSEYQAGQLVSVQSTSTDTSGVIRVELSVDGAVVRTDAPPQPQLSFTVIQDWTATEGQHTLAVRSFTASGESSNTAAVVVQVLPAAALVPTIAPPAATATPVRPSSPVPAPTLTSPPSPTVSPSPTPTLTPTPMPTIACDSSAFVADITVPDGTLLSEGQAFNKIWRIRNTGACTWGPGYAFTFVGGAPIAPYRAVAVPYTPPGATSDLIVPMTAPTVPGTFVSEWRLSTPTGAHFGVTVFVKINVIAPAAPAPAVAPAPTTGCSGTPSIAYFTVSPATITAGQSATLSWGFVGNAGSAQIDNGIGGVATPGSVTVNPGTTTTYTLTAACGSTTTTARVTITVNTGACSGSPAIQSFTASPTTITRGATTTLSWGLVANADAATIDNGIGGVPTPGSIVISPTTTTTYTLTGSCGSNTATAQVTITVNP